LAINGEGGTVAYNLDSGDSATMWFNGELVNNPFGEDDERGTSDILYIGAQLPSPIKRKVRLIRAARWSTLHQP
jgi:hypothetical protein